MKIHRHQIYFLVIVFGLAAGVLLNCAGGQKLAVTNLKCEYLKNPLGIDIPQPRLSWTVSSNLRGISQSAYRILVADNREFLRDDTGNIWDSGEVSSAQSVNVVYDGEQLQSGDTYYWKVRIWNQDAEQSPWSEINTFHTGLLQPSDWEAEWITAGDAALQAPLLRTKFEVDKRIESAHAYVTGVGYYELYLNGGKVGDHVLDPGMTNYRKRVLYTTYDVTDQLNSGVNAAGIILGNGAYRMERVEGRYSWGGGGAAFGAPRALLQLDIAFSDGTEKRIITDGSWQSSSGPITFNHFYGGE
ncbi:MAG TPA: alpha-L-rhamnosidase N-terminal domain-containing protein, partial [bacterium]|nr:alpha-L-rhamnosidase N-terminal domain-containing protein [bacterium]